MGIKIQNKPLYASLIALVLAIAMAMSGIGFALGAPDDAFDRHAAMEDKTTAEFEAFLDHHGSDGTCMFCGEVSSENNGFCGDFGSLTRGDLFQGWNWYEGMLNFSYMGAFCNQADNYAMIQDLIDSFPADSAFIKWLKGEDDSDQSTPGVAFTLNFRATGIQATGFKDYKEAFAALNGSVA